MNNNNYYPSYNSYKNTGYTFIEDFVNNLDSNLLQNIIL